MTKIPRFILGAVLLLSISLSIKSDSVKALSLPTQLVTSKVSTPGEAPIPSEEPITLEVVPDGAIPPKDPESHGLDSSLYQVRKALQNEGWAGAAQGAGENGLSIRDGKATVIAAVEKGRQAEVQAALAGIGVQIEASYSDLIQASVPIAMLEEVKDLPGIRHVRSPDKPMALSVVSEGLSVTEVNSWKSQGYNGRGVKVGVLDVGFEGYTSLLGRELPPTVTAKSFRTDGDITGAGSEHGTAVAEIVYDVAPDASFYLANFDSQVEFGLAVDWMISQGVSVVVSAVGWPGAGPGDGTGAIANMVKKAKDAGIFWTQAAGNFGQTHWTGTYRDLNGNGFHDFAPGDEGNTITLAPTGKGESIYKIEIVLTWDDWEKWQDDYDMFLFKGAEVVKDSTSFQRGQFPPVEKITYVTAVPGQYWIAIQRFKASRSNRLDLITTVDYQMEYRVPEESLVLPADSPDAVAVGSIPVSGSPLQPYSSQGPTKDGRVKPDLVAPDAVSTTRYGPQGFLGTSASAPLVAGMAALIKQAAPHYSPDRIRAFLEGGATRMGDPPKNNLYGFGMANMAQSPPPRVVFPIMLNGATLLR